MADRPLSDPLTDTLTTQGEFLSGKGVMRACSAAHWEEYFVVCESVWASWSGRRPLGRQPRTDRRPAITTKKWSCLTSRGEAEHGAPVRRFEALHPTPTPCLLPVRLAHRNWVPRLHRARSRPERSSSCSFPCAPWPAATRSRSALPDLKCTV